MGRTAARATPPVASGPRAGQRRTAKPSLRLRSGDTLALDGKKRDWEALAAKLEGGGGLEYYAYHKPEGVACTTDANDRRSLRRAPALKKLFAGGKRVFPAGRLDVDSCGLVLLTNDGAAADASALQPSSKLDKVYEVELDRRAADDDVAALAAGVEIATPLQRGSKAEKTGKRCPATRRGGGRRWLVVTLAEGRNRQLRRMAEALGYEVTSLRRVAFGPVSLGDLRPGTLRPLRGGRDAVILAE
ncbi:RNA pseudouridylate synthase [Aureococcus anophagefferens]|uniref:RNA pseudouridylate synthase n=1 Tax=Aureococcus anophagefferens TaxID=44056 RepID=A0ABR1FHJ2_AURAN